MAQQSYLWEGDLVAGFDYVDLWTHEEYGNGDALGEIIAGYVIVTRDLADGVLLSDTLATVRLLYLDLVDQATSGAIQQTFFWEGDLVTGFDYVDLWTHEEYGNGDALFGQGGATGTVSVALLTMADTLEAARLLYLGLADQAPLADPDTQLFFSKDGADVLVLPSGSLDVAIIRIRDFADSVGFLPDTSVVDFLRQRDLFDGVLIQDVLSASGGVVSLANAVSLIYRPRLLVSLTISSETKRYSSEDLEA